MCAASEYRNKPYKPIKIYLDDLYRRYKLKDSHVQEELDEL